MTDKISLRELVDETESLKKVEFDDGNALITFNGRTQGMLRSYTSGYKDDRPIEAITFGKKKDVVVITYNKEQNEAYINLQEDANAIETLKNTGYDLKDVNRNLATLNTDVKVKINSQQDLERLIDDVKRIKFGSHKLESELERVREKFPNATDEELEQIAENDLKFAYADGNNSGIVAANHEKVAKQASKENNNIEARIYGLDLPEFQKYMPRFEELIELQNSSLLVTSNAESEVSGYLKSGYIPFNPDGSFNCHNFVMHNLFLMGLFHKEATEAVRQSDIILGPSTYVRGKILHYDAMRVPLDPSAYKQLKSDTPIYLSDEVRPIVDAFRASAREGKLSVIDGDWKTGSPKHREKGNIINGHKVDYAMVAWGKEVEDYAWFMAGLDYEPSREQMKFYLGCYIGLRSEHDHEFAVDKQKHREMYELLDSGEMHSLVRWASCLNRRNLSMPSQTERRNGYIARIQENLRSGNFI